MLLYLHQITHSTLIIVQPKLVIDILLCIVFDLCICNHNSVQLVLNFSLFGGSLDR